MVMIVIVMTSSINEKPNSARAHKNAQRRVVLTPLTESPRVFEASSVVRPKNIYCLTVTLP